MKNKLLCKLFIGYLFISISLNAQEKTLNCEYNMQEAVFYLTKGEFEDPQKAIEYLKPCVEAEFADAQLLMGRIYLNYDKEKDFKKGFHLIQKAAKQENAAAACELGILYKYGKGCALNLNQAEKWFKNADKLGNDKATYSLGYMYYKGLGTIKQDYTEAVKWFNKSNHPMAKYWLGICYYNGYGVSKDLQKANDLLKNSIIEEDNFENSINTNSIVNENSKILEEQIQVLNNSTVSDQEISIIADFTPEMLNGKWTGTLNQLDWSNSKIEQSSPITLQLEYNEIASEVNYTWTFNGVEYSESAMYDSNTLYFENLYLSLNHLSFNNKIPNNLDYQILSSNFKLKTINENTYLTASIESFVKLWKESGSPISLVLTKEKALTENGKEITEEILQALAIQKDSFIKLYPNPFVTDLLIAYTLEYKGQVSIEISSLDGTQRYIIETEKQQKSGDYTYYFDGSILKNGLYAISIVVNGMKNNKIIIKE